jgi:hypothetical protein
MRFALEGLAVSDSFEIGTVLALRNGVREQRRTARRDAQGRRCVLSGGPASVGRLREAGAVALAAGGAALGTAPKRVWDEAEGATAQGNATGGWAVAERRAAQPRPWPTPGVPQGAPVPAALASAGHVPAGSPAVSPIVVGRLPSATTSAGGQGAAGGRPRANVVRLAPARPLSARAAGMAAAAAPEPGPGAPGVRQAPVLPRLAGIVGDKIPARGVGASLAPVSLANSPEPVPGAPRVAGAPRGQVPTIGGTAAAFAPTARAWPAAVDAGQARRGWAVGSALQTAGEVGSGDPDDGDSSSTVRGGGGSSGSDSGGGQGQQQMQGDVFLDGVLVGRWMSRWLNREADRASAGRTGFDARRGRLLPGATVGSR